MIENEAMDKKSSELKYEKRIVAFLDILGFRARIMQGTSGAEALIREIDDAISHATDIVVSQGPESVSVRLFSDCFCISCNPLDLSLLIRELSFLQLFLCTSGVFVRGSISTGHHFENKRIIFSEGLIRAYDLQARDKYPRITIDDPIVRRITDETCNHYGDKLVEYLIVAPDGAYFLDYLHILTREGFNVLTDELFEKHRTAIMKGAKAAGDDFAVVEKYKWLAGYHNAKFLQFFTEDDYWPESWAEMREQMLVPDSIFPSFKLGSLNFSRVDTP
jgi:hypothetical protein